ncbi:hypothetical protein Q9L58_010129, partial [Maublancomyces gigas]
TRPARLFQLVALRVLRDSLVSLSVGGVCALQLGEPAEQTIGDLSDWPLLTKVHCTMTGLVGTRATATAHVVDLLPMGIREFGLRRTDGLSELRPDQEWTAPEMTDQLCEVVLQRPRLMVVTVNMDEEVYHAEMMQRLAVASGTRGLVDILAMFIIYQNIPVGHAPRHWEQHPDYRKFRTLEPLTGRAGRPLVSGLWYKTLQNN